MGGGERRRVGDQLRQSSEVLRDCRQRELVPCAVRASKTQPAEPQDAFQVREPHLDTLAIVPRLLEGCGASKRSSDVAGSLVDAAGNFASWGLGAASGFQWARGAISCFRDRAA